MVEIDFLPENNIMTWFRSFIKIVFPSRCLVCGTYEMNDDAVVCGICRKALPILEGQFCRCCGRSFVSNVPFDHLCGDCLQDPPSFTTARSLASYEEPLVTLLRKFKYNKDTSVLPLIKELSSLFIPFLPQDVDIILPVPLHKQRLRSRGYNQSLLLARAMFPHHKPIIVPNVLKRVENSVSQAGLNKKERSVNLRNAFDVRLPEYVRNKKVCLVDDVYTTGATLNECSKVLVNTGACEVFGVTVARTPLRAGSR